MEIMIVRIPPPGESGKILTDINVNLQPHPAKPPSAFLFVKGKVFKTSYAPLLQGVLGPDRASSHVPLPSTLGNATLSEDNLQSDTQNQCRALRQLF